ncbi:hypothetical protein V6N13_098236 [Hibiscus sabdariffa]|uniref:Uncharacterized protein n=1 Tax=Hibiscus sabdariffa TaxID=183260 RepID=A0ABR2EDK5_9ROSI
MTLPMPIKRAKPPRQPLASSRITPPTCNRTISLSTCSIHIDLHTSLLRHRPQDRTNLPSSLRVPRAVCCRKRLRSPVA